MDKSVPIIIISILLLCFVISLAKADTTQTFTVPALSSTTDKLNLTQGDSVSGSVSVVGGSGNDINFVITDPNGNNLGTWDRTTYNTFSFSASISGTYTLTFDNSFSLLSSKSVTLDYSVQSASPFSENSLPLLLLIVFVILIVIIIVVAVVVFAMRRSKATNYVPPTQAGAHT